MSESVDPILKLSSAAIDQRGLFYFTLLLQKHSVLVLPSSDVTVIKDVLAWAPRVAE
jgi:hypothetical protein